jgi:hypothetical protein
MEVVKEFGSPSAWSVAAEYDFRALAFCKHISASLECERLEYRFARPCQISNSVTPSSSPWSTCRRTNEECTNGKVVYESFSTAHQENKPAPF